MPLTAFASSGGAGGSAVADVFLSLQDAAPWTRDAAFSDSLTNRLSELFQQQAGPTSSARGLAALVSMNTVVLLPLISMVDWRSESYQVPLLSGSVVQIYREHVIIGGAVLAFSPLTRTVLATRPLVAQKGINSESPATDSRRREVLALAAEGWVGIAAARSRDISSRVRRAPVETSLLRRVLLKAGRRDGVAKGMTVAVSDASGAGYDCIVETVHEDSAPMRCERAPGGGAVGLYLVSSGVDMPRYQVVEVTITSPKATELLGQDERADKTAIAFTASDALSADGEYVIPPSYVEKDVTEFAKRAFMKTAGVTDRELGDFELKFPGPDVRVSVDVDGYNSAIVGEGPINRIRAHKAWASVTIGQSAWEGIGTTYVDEISGWQKDVLQKADAREAIHLAVRCAVTRFQGGECP